MQLRVIPYDIFDAATNMAIDEMLLEKLIAEPQYPILRFYGFSPAAVTIGFNQTPPRILLENCRRFSYDIARRPTGGRAVFHQGELTYAFIAAESKQDNTYGLLAGSVSGAYRQICSGLQFGLEEIGVESQLGRSASAQSQAQDCFVTITGADLQVQGKKIAGSAQLRRSGVVLQHGSIILKQSQNALPTLLGETFSSPEPRHANLLELLSEAKDHQQIQDCIIHGFCRAFSLVAHTQELLPVELGLAEANKERFIVMSSTGAETAEL